MTIIHEDEFKETSADAGGALDFGGLEGAIA